MACRSAVRAGLAFPCHAQPRPRVCSGRNPQIDGTLTLQAALAVAIRAALADDLSRALARRTGARDGEESLLVPELAASAASLACGHASSGLCARAIARFAIFLARQFDFRGHARCAFLKRERHVIAQIRPALHTSSPPPSARKTILEPEKVSEDVVKTLEDGAAEISAARAGKTVMPVGVVDLALLRVYHHAVVVR